MTPDLSVVIVTWNVRELVLDCLQSVHAAADGLIVECIVVDNASADGTAGAIRESFPDVRVLEAGANLGFPRANNIGVAAAGGRHILFLNPDTVVAPQALRACVDELDANADVGVVGCLLRYPDGSPQFESGRRIYRLRHLAAEVLFLNMMFPKSRVFGHHLIGDWDHGDDRDVEAVSGAFMMARRAAVDDVGGLPDELFMYHEDMAFCLRARRTGWRVRMLGRVSTLHYSGRSARQRPDPGIILLSGEYRLHIIREHEGRLASAAARCLLAVRSAVRMLAGAIVPMVPGTSPIRERHPLTFDIGAQWLLLRWAVAPWSVEHLQIRAPVTATPPGQAMVGSTPAGVRR